MAGTTYEIEMTRHLKQKPDVAYAIVKDIARFPEFMPNVVSLEVLEEDGNRKVAHWDTIIDDAPLDWVEEGIYDDARRRVEYRSLEGVFDRFDGYWQVRPELGGSRIEFELTYEIGLPEIEMIIGPILKDKMIENVEGMLEAIEKRIDEAR